MLGQALVHVSCGEEEGRQPAAQAHSVVGLVGLDREPRVEIIDHNVLFLCRAPLAGAATEKRLSVLGHQAQGLEASIQELNQNKAEVAAVHEELSSLKLAVKEIHTHISDLASDRQTLKDVELQIDELREIYEMVEERAQKVGVQMEKIAEVEGQVKDLGLLTEDVRAKYASLSHDKDVLDRANARIHELRGILKEAERRIERS